MRIDRFSIGEAARAAGVSVKMIRHYERIGLVSAAERTNGGARLFGASEVHTLKFIGRARSLGFPLETARKLLSLWRNPNRSNKDTLHLAESHMEELVEKEKALISMEKALQELIDACDGDGRPECPILDDLADVKSRSKRGAR